MLGLTFDQRLTSILHVREIKTNFAAKLDLLKRSRFLPTKVLSVFYFRVILPSVQYGLILWGACGNQDLFCSIERLHCRAARIIFNSPKDMASRYVLERDHRPTPLYLLNKMDVFKLFYKAPSETLPELLSKIIYSKRSNGYSLRGDDSQLVTRFNTRYMKDSLAYRSAVLLNTISINEPGFSRRRQNELCNRLKTKTYFRDFKFNVVSASVVRR